MKKFVIVIVIVIVSASASWAQKRIGQLSFIPRVGLNLSDLGGINGLCNDHSTHNSAVRPDFMLGADVEYQVLKPLGVSLGAYYSRQGCRWSTYYEKVSDTEEIGYEDQALKLQYVNIPLKVSYYINEYISVHAGVQCGIYLNGYWDWNENKVTLNTKTGERTYGTSEKNHQKMTEMNSLQWSVPVGISLEYEHAVVDISYAFPVSKFCKTDAIGTGGNRVWTISVGYRL